jgi:protein TonB
MYANGYFEQRRRSPTSFALVVALHAAGFGALILAGGTQIIDHFRPPTKVTFIPIPPDPAPIPPPRPREPTPERLTTTPQDPVIPADDAVTAVDQRPHDPPIIGGGTGEQVVVPQRPPDPPTPVRREAQVDSRYASALQPPYPPAQERAQRGGRVRLRVTVAADGRVAAVQRLEATNDDFWRATERQALNRWRFRPATLDGRPVQGTIVMTVHFRIEDV